MKIISLYDGKDVIQTGLIGTLKTSAGMKKIKKMIFDSSSTNIDTIPNSIFTLLLYKKDSFSDTIVGVERYLECQLVKKHTDNITLEVAFKTMEHFNTDNMNEIRSSRIALFLEDEDEDESEE